LNPFGKAFRPERWDSLLLWRMLEYVRGDNNRHHNTRTTSDPALGWALLAAAVYTGTRR
jgi:hypothetical protein